MKKFLGIVGVFCLFFVFGCEKEEGTLSKNSLLSIEEKLALDEDFIGLIEDYEIIMKSMIEKTAKLDKVKQKRVLELSKKVKVTEDEIKEVSTLLNINDSIFERINKKVNSLKNKFEVQNLSQSNFEGAVQNIFDRKSRNMKISACKKGYGTCLVKTYATGAATIVACGSLGPFAPACIAAATIATVAGYEECAINFCGGGFFEK